MTNFKKVGSCNSVAADFSRNAFPEINSDLSWERGHVNKQDGVHTSR